MQWKYTNCTKHVHFEAVFQKKKKKKKKKKKNRNFINSLVIVDTLANNT